ncbi:response regulator [Neomicrococcus lactis]|uniref:response regulator n=1 Tax=Neomicrococcus lactis TaxID=732241 RepID=UPI0023016546|nr:response regulator [Neomicrococcus lactis]
MIKVLVVDDDFMVAKVNAGFVKQVPGFSVIGATHTGAAALEAVRKYEPDLVLLDIYLPDMSGLELLQKLREVDPELDVLIISAAREADTVRKALRGGIVHYLMKPFSASDLRERLVHYQNTYHPLSQVSETADQQDIDKIFGFGVQDKRLPKGFSAETLEKVIEILRGSEANISAAEAAEVLGTSRVSARRYLEYLNEQGKVEIDLRYGMGRPERRYGWKP